MIRVGDRVRADFVDVGMTHRERVICEAVVTAVHPSPRVRPDGWTHDRPVRWADITPLPAAARTGR